MRDGQTRDSSTPNFTPEFQKILESIQKNTATEIDLRSYNLGDDEAKALAVALTKNITLIKFYLSFNKIGPEGAEALAGALSVNTTLVHLNLSYNKIGDDGAKVLAEALKVNGALEELDLSKNNIGPAGVKDLAGALRVNTSLTGLALCINNIGDDVAQAFAEALGVNETLTELNLSYNNIGPNGAQALAGALIKNYTLLELRMSPSINEDLETQIRTCLARNNIINQISNYYTQDLATSPFPRIDDELIQDPQICLKIFEKSLSKIIDSKKANGQEVNEEQISEIREKFIEHLKSSREGMRLLLSCKEEKNSFGLNLRDYLRSMGVVSIKKNDRREIGNGQIAEEIFTKSDIFPNIQKYLPPLVKASAKAPSANPSSTRANRVRVSAFPELDVI